MAGMPKGPEEFPLGRLTADQFEMLTFLLARDENPGVVHVRRKDHGLDARLPDARGATLRGWQSKPFLDRIYWDQCQESVSRALAFWRPLRITFVFAKVLSAKEQDEFRTKLIERFARVRLDWWDASELQPRMRDTPGGRRAADWLFGNPEADTEAFRRALAVGGELSDAGQAAARIAEVQKFMSRDPHLRYTTVAREEGAPDLSPAPETIASFQADFGGIQVRFDASERYAGSTLDAGLGGTLSFSDDEQGRLAYRAAQRVIAEGGRVELTSGVHAKFSPVPVGLRGLLSEEEMTGTFVISAEGERARQAGLTLPMTVRAGSAELGLVLAEAEPPDGWEVGLAGSAGGLRLLMSMRSQQAFEQTIKFRWRLGEGTALEQLLAAEVMLAGYQGADIQLVTPGNGEVVAVMTIDERPNHEEEMAEIESIREFLGYAADAEAWLGAALNPPAQPTEADARILSWLVSQIHTPKREGTFTRLEFVLVRPVVGLEQPFQMMLPRALRAPLFGQERYVGTEVIYVSRARFDAATGDEQVGDTIGVVPDGDDTVTVEFCSPTLVPEGAAAPPGYR